MAVVPFPSRQGGGGFAMHAGWAFSRRVAILLDVGMSGGFSGDSFGEHTGALVVRCWPTSRVRVEAGPASAQLVGHYEDAMTTDLNGSGVHAAVGGSLMRRPRWTLDIGARFESIRYDGFRSSKVQLTLGASRLPS